MKTLFILLFVASSCLNLNGQWENWRNGSTQRNGGSRTKIEKDSIILQTDVEVMQFYLAKYHAERRGAMALTFISTLSGGLVLATNSTDVQKILAGTSIISALGSMLVFFDSEKWLKKATIKIAPGSVKVVF